MVWLATQLHHSGRAGGPWHLPAVSPTHGRGLEHTQLMIDTAIIGAGPYGLSIAAHLRSQGLPFRIFGPPMDSWRRHMPKGMFLKSDGFASNLYSADGNFTVKKFCAERGIAYDDTRIPVSLDTFIAYGLAFRERLVPELEEKFVTAVERSTDGFTVRLEDGEIVRARRVVLAVGITHFEYTPTALANLPREFVSHSFGHHDLQPFRGRKVTVIGGGASAIELAALLRDLDVDVHQIIREKALKFHGVPSEKPRPLWKRIRHPQSGLGPGLRSLFYADYPMLFHFLPEHLRGEIVGKHLGPSGHWISKDRVVGRVPLHAGCTIEKATVQDNKVHLHLREQDGAQSEIVSDHVIAGTGYRVDLNRLAFLNPEIRSQVKLASGSPVLSSTFESSVPGLYFVGLAAAQCFGPVMRFAFGAGFAASCLTKRLEALAARGRSFSPAPHVEAVKNPGTRAL
jgi:thioredoxin reductase